jgi:hypothetical protein
VAEREGFEPSIRFCRILTFQASAFDHSATAPHILEGEVHLVKGRPQGKAAAKASIARASSISRGVRPPALCVVRAMSTRFQLFDQSGW